MRFRIWCNSVLLEQKLEADPRLKKIGHATALAWLEKLGFSFCAHTKSIYYDGHERDDVVMDRAEKLAMLKALEEVTVHFSGANCEVVVWPELFPLERPVVWVSQDECAFHSNDDRPAEWVENGKGLQIRQKSRGSLIMASAFVSELSGILKCTNEQRDAYILTNEAPAMKAKLAINPAWNGSSTLILEPGAAAGKDKYFDAEQLHEQTKLAMEVFEAAGHTAPGRWAYHVSKSGRPSRATYPLAFVPVWCPPVACMGLWFFDHSSGGGACVSPHPIPSARAQHIPAHLSPPHPTPPLCCRSWRICK